MDLLLSAPECEQVSGRLKQTTHWKPFIKLQAPALSTSSHYIWHLTYTCVYFISMLKWFHQRVKIREVFGIILLCPNERRWSLHIFIPKCLIWHAWEGRVLRANSVCCVPACLILSNESATLAGYLNIIIFIFQSERILPFDCDQMLVHAEAPSGS